MCKCVCWCVVSTWVRVGVLVCIHVYMRACVCVLVW
jgi:hypothetical protein